MRIFGFAVLVGSWSAAGGGDAHAADAEAGKRIFETVCHQCHAALPYTGRIGVENLPKFLANPRRYKPTTAMTFPGLRSRKDIDDVIAYITGSQ
jgi:cytochrome c2